MRKRFIQGMLAGLTAVLVGAAVIAPLVMKLGLVPVNADRRPPAWEARLLGMAVHASVARHAEERPNPVPPTEENLIAGAELFWIVKHGIRNTAMPAWGRQLSDEDIRQVVAFLKRLDPLPPAVAAEWKKGRHSAVDQ